MSFIKELQTNINKVTDGYFANWTPELPVNVGDFGTIKAYRFTRDGNVDSYNLGINIDSVRVRSATFEKISGVKISANASAAGSIVDQKTKFDLLFGKEGSFLYHLTDITNNRFKERKAAFKKICQLILSEKIDWKDDYVLVVEVKQSRKALIIVADSANANIQVECRSDLPIGVNLANTIGNISYTQGSDQVIKYEVNEVISPLFRVVEFSSDSKDASNNPISKLKEMIKSWFGGKLPEPESISLSEYVEKVDQTEGVFELTNGKSITMYQRIVYIDSFINKSEQLDYMANYVLPLGESESKYRT